MTRALLTSLVVLALVPASASAATSEVYTPYQYGVDAYLRCVGQAGPGATATVADQVACANELALDLTDGGQLRRLPICLRNRTTEFAAGENRDPVGTSSNCAEQYLGTNVTAALPHVTTPPPAR